VATANLDNSGSFVLSVSADAFAGDAGSATAYASIDTGIAQYARASSAANVSLDNIGTIDVLMSASASADEDASATAGIDTVIFQSAWATGDAGDASVSLTNTGGINVAATATAVGGGDVTASAYIDYGIDQNAYGGDSGTANITLVNDNSLSMVANASALGGGDGYAGAFASGITQSATAGGGASVSVDNNDDILVSAAATVLVGNAAHRGAGATASAYASGIHQYAEARTYDSTGTGPNFTDGGGFTVLASPSDVITGVAFTATNNGGYTGSGPASASVNNSGMISVLASASAVADNVALAYAGATAITQ
jgi:hypothetical protein